MTVGDGDCEGGGWGGEVDSIAVSLFTNRDMAMLSTMKVILKEMLNNVQVLEWEKVPEDWIRAGRHLMLLHYEEVANIGF